MNYKDLNFHIADAVEPQIGSINYRKRYQVQPASGVCYTTSGTSYTGQTQPSQTSNTPTSNSVSSILTNLGQYFNGTSTAIGSSLFATAPALKEYPLAKLHRIPYEDYIGFLYGQSLLPNTTRNGWITTDLEDGKMIPMIDVDYDFKGALEYIETFFKTPYASFTSTDLGSNTAKGWIFFDMIDTFNKTRKVLEQTRWNDAKYRKYTLQRKQFCVRGHFKTTFVPQLNFMSSNASEPFKEWVNAFDVFWHCEDMKRINSNYVLEAL